MFKRKSRSSFRLKKIILLIFIAGVLILIGKIVYFEYYKLCGRCYKPIAPNTVSQMRDDANLTMWYSKDNGSLPPPDHRIYVYRISTDAQGGVKGVYEVRDYKKAIETKPLMITSDQLKSLLAAASKINPDSDESINSGCTGGSVKSIEITQIDKVLLKASGYSCAGSVTNESLEKASSEIENIISMGKLVE